MELCTKETKVRYEEAGQLVGKVKVVKCHQVLAVILCEVYKQGWLIRKRVW